MINLKYTKDMRMAIILYKTEPEIAIDLMVQHFPEFKKSSRSVARSFIECEIAVCKGNKKSKL